VDEGLRELKTEEELAPTAPMSVNGSDNGSVDGSDDVPSETLVPDSLADASRSQSVYSGWLRLAYMFEFLLALNVVYTLWSEIGGQGHMDLLPWYTKLVCGVGLSWAVVRFTAGIVETEKFWNWRARRWFIIILFFAIAMGGIVYYYHLHEVPDESDSEDGAATSVQLPHADRQSQRI